MRKLHILSGSLLALAISAHGQVSNPSIIPSATDPTGVACTNSPPNLQYQGTMFTCKGGVWTATGSGGTVAYSVIAPSGDTTGVTDNAAIQSAITAGNPVQLQSGNYYITGLTCSAACTVVGTNPGTTILNMVSTTNNFFTVSYGDSSYVVSPGSRIEYLWMQYKTGVVPTAGYGISVSGVSNSFMLSGLHFANNYLEKLFGGIQVGPFVFMDFFTNNIVVDALAGGNGGIVYNNPAPAGDVFFDGMNMSGFNTGLNIVQADTAEFTNLKLNGSGIVFTNSAAQSIDRLRFINPSIEGTGNVGGTPACGIDLGTNQSNVAQIQVVGGGIGLLPTAICNFPAGGATSILTAYFNRYTGETPTGWIQVGYPTMRGYLDISPGLGDANTDLIRLTADGGFPEIAIFAAPGGSITSDWVNVPASGTMYFDYNGTGGGGSGSLNFRNAPNGGTTVLRADKDGLMYHNTFTVATLPACAAATVDAETMVTDATAFTFGSAPTGGSNIHVPVYCQASGAGPTYAWIMY